MTNKDSLKSLCGPLKTGKKVTFKSLLSPSCFLLLTLPSAPKVTAHIIFHIFAAWSVRYNRYTFPINSCTARAAASCPNSYIAISLSHRIYISN